MTCKLCAKKTTTSAVDLFSAEANDLQILELIQEHIPILQLDRKQDSANLICTNCCKILRDFHELYVLVENAQKLYVFCDPLLQNDFGLETKHVKQEPESADYEKNAKKQFILKEKINPIIGKPNAVNEAENSNDNDLECKKFKVFHTEMQRMSAKPTVLDLNLGKRISKCVKSDSALDEVAEVKTVKERNPSDYDDFLAKNFKLCCDKCKLPLANFAEMKSHFRKEHRINGFVSCCGKKFRHRCRLVDHVLTHLNPDMFKCAECNKVLADRRGLQEHLQSHERKLERAFQCTTCLKSYPRRSSLMRHVQEHVPEEEKKIQCPQCEKTYATFYLMHQHLKIVHLNRYCKICDICGKSIRGSREVFQLHQLEHSGAPKPEVECELCGLKLTSKYGLNRHVKVVHLEKAKPQTCTICSKNYLTKASYKSHINYVHNLQRKHQCSICDKTFKKSQVLKEHMATHTGEALYTCPNCPKKFISSANMHTHRKKVHRKEWEEARIKRQPRKYVGTLVEDR